MKKSYFLVLKTIFAFFSRDMFSAEKKCLKKDESFISWNTFIPSGKFTPGGTCIRWFSSGFLSYLFFEIKFSRRSGQISNLLISLNTIETLRIADFVNKRFQVNRNEACQICAKFDAAGFHI